MRGSEGPSARLPDYLAASGFFAQAQSLPQLHFPPLSHPQVVSPHALHFIVDLHKTGQSGEPMRCKKSAMGGNSLSAPPYRRHFPFRLRFWTLADSLRHGTMATVPI